LRKPKTRVWAIARKEFFHIIHDPRSLIIIFLLPVIQLLMFGYALDMEIKKVDLAVIDYSHGTYSRNLIEKFQGSSFFHVFHYEGLLDDIEELFLSREARAILIINKDFDKSFPIKTNNSIQLIIDAVDPNAATLIRNYCYEVITSFNRSYSKASNSFFNVHPTIKYNPDLKSDYFFVPGILALLLVMICALLTSVTITREKEMGTMEQILVSPVQPNEIILGKVLPYIGIAILIAMLIVAIGVFLFEVPFLGNLLLAFCLTTLYIITALSLGLMISTIASTQQVAMMIAIIATMLPTVFLSGFIFPIPSMPKTLQIISYIVPAKYFLMIIRGIMLKGNTFLQLIQQTILLVAISLALMIMALKRFKVNLED
jgi:ABC-2 type transport system permease protein